VNTNDLHHVLALMREGNWRAAHDRVQLDTTELGAWLHGLLHVQEGDLEDAEYWFGHAGRNFRGRRTLDEELALLETKLQDVYTGPSRFRQDRNEPEFVIVPGRQQPSRT
jgi:hypothetical protein